MLRKTILIFCILINNSLFGRGYFNTFNIDYPLLTNSFKGIFSTSLNHNRYINNNTLSNEKFSTYYQFGVSYALLKNPIDKQLHNIYLNGGINLNTALSENISSYFYLNFGYSIFKDQILKEAGSAIELGTFIARSKYLKTIALHISYRQHFVSAFNYTDQNKIIDGRFGKALIGLSYLF